MPELDAHEHGHRLYGLCYNAEEQPEVMVPKAYGLCRIRVVFLIPTSV